jgi:hypothetical protein
MVAVGAQEYTQQAPVTAWIERAVLTAVVMVCIAAMVWAMARNWRKRSARQAWVVLPPGPPAGFTPQSSYPARYVASVATENWLERIAAAGLGMPGRAKVSVDPSGVLIERVGEQNLFLPTHDILQAQSARGIAQEVYESDGLVAITWRTGQRSVTTGLRLTRAEDHLALLSALAALQDGDRSSSEGKAEA